MCRVKMQNVIVVSVAVLRCFVGEADTMEASRQVNVRGPSRQALRQPHKSALVYARPFGYIDS